MFVGEHCIVGETLGPTEALHVFPHFKTLSGRALPLRESLLSHAIFFIKATSRISYFPCLGLLRQPYIYPGKGITHFTSLASTS